jgi:hypothetical protein
MSLPFSRSMRSLHADSYRFSLAVFIGSIGLLTAWAAWFFLARITLYETGQIVGTTRRGTVVAQLPAQAAEKIRRGQLAVVRLQGPLVDQSGTLPGTVQDVTKKADQVRVELYMPQKIAAPINSQERMAGQVEIAVEHVSPATLLTQPTGQFLIPPAVSLSPSQR